MAVIVGIHGIAQQFRGGYQLGTVWFDALRDGLATAGYRPTADALTPADLRVAYFGDLFRPGGAMAVQEPPFSAADVQPGPIAPAGGPSDRSCATAAWYNSVSRSRSGPG